MSARYQLAVLAKKDGQTIEIITDFKTRKAARERARQLYIDAFLPNVEVDHLISVTIFDNERIDLTQYMHIDDISFYWFDKYGRCK